MSRASNPFADLVSLTVPSDATALLVGNCDRMAGLNGGELFVANRRMKLDQLMGFRARGCQYLLLPHPSRGAARVSRQIRSFLHPGTSPLSKLDLGPFEVHSMV